MVDTIERAIPIPKLQIAVHRAARRQTLWESPPLAASGKYIHHAIDHFAHGDRPLAASALRRRDLLLDQLPFFIGQVAWIAQVTAVV